MDEFPPKYFLSPNDPALVWAGKDKGGQRGPLVELTDKKLLDHISRSTKKPSTNLKPQLEQSHGGITVDMHPEFSLTWGHAANPPKDDSLWDNSCWPSVIAAGDPGFVLLSLDKWNDKNPKGSKGQRPKWNYNKSYVKRHNGD
ncbi:uncharacterized protein TrAFT101_011407 [Trichoderma asperellum]|uniref:Uncharacterized protein n=1 Tax=Trichoderma asperellum (strain ATCC 204424 / CBS 433.97 / NBRC 101777) TaxID=1042311 RepID=A0A2T3YRY0_TRIA4|nr:hypothetical protein M441DRAFT_52295 [Trichoderma asperellum CBS 433.97]PTB35325.1 hypothetical protein M441DRAFT_52295 [Trichoderma asperellum CBS 433.97]UKZ96629.1 hypothetical protein TrAFT101_011407 [Trichoderma asperellum]